MNRISTTYSTAVEQSTVTEDVVTTQTVYDTSISTVRETPTETLYTATVTVTVAPNTLKKREAQPTIPTYATPCSGAVRYTSACSCIGVSSASTVTAPTSTSWVTLPTTVVASVTATAVVSTDVEVIYVATNTVTVTDAPATVSLITTETVTSTSTVPAAPTNLLSNAGFEASGSISPWYRFGGGIDGVVSTSLVRTGSQSALVRVGQRTAIGMQQRVAVDVNENYQFTIWARQTTLACSVLYVACSSSPSNYFTLGTTSGALALNTWKELSVTCNWRADRLENAAVTVFLPSSCSLGAQVFFDDASLVKF